jgi:hypothetical protein
MEDTKNHSCEHLLHASRNTPFTRFHQSDIPEHKRICSVLASRLAARTAVALERAYRATTRSQVRCVSGAFTTSVLISLRERRVDEGYEPLPSAPGQDVGATTVVFCTRRKESLSDDVDLVDVPWRKYRPGPIDDAGNRETRHNVLFPVVCR